MALTDRIITLVGLMKIEFPARTVRLCDGGFARYAGEDYSSRDAVFGTIAGVDAIEDAVGDAAPGGGFTLFPDPEAGLINVFVPDLQNSRVRIWLGELDNDGVSVIHATQLVDQLVDTVDLQLVLGSRSLDFTTIGRAEKLFLRSEGNVCSTAFHQSVWPGEKGFDNCTDLEGQVAWGIEGPPRATNYGGGFNGYIGVFGPGGKLLHNSEKYA